jgi:hypothetical protein
MGKYLKILVLTICVMSLGAGTALAGTILVNNGTAFKVGVETLGTARNVTILGTAVAAATPNAANAALSYTLGQSLAAATLLNITLTGATFQAGTYSICALASNGSSLNNKVAGITMVAGTSSVNLAIDTSAGPNVNAGQFLAFVNGSACNNLSAATANFSISPVASVGAPTVSGFLQTGGVIYDSAAAVNVATVLSQFAYGTPTAATSTIDYLTGARNGSQFTGSVNAATAATAAVNVTTVAVNYGIAETPTPLTASEVLSLVDTQAWQGVSRVYLGAQGAGACAFGANIAANSAPSGTVNLAWNGGTGAQNFNTVSATAGSNFAPLCIDVTGNVAINARTITGTPQITIATVANGAQSPAAGAATTLETWVVNAFQAIIPYAHTTPTFKTVCMVDNIDPAAAASISATIVSSSGATVSAPISLGTLGAKTTTRYDFDTNITPYSQVGGVETAGTPIATGLTDPQRYAVKLTVSSNPDNIHVNCLQVDTLAGIKRNVPVLKQISGGNGWVQ